MAINNDFMFTATKFGIIEVWLRERVRKATSIKTAHAKITSLTSDMDETMLFAGSYDGKIQVRTKNKHNLMTDCWKTN